MQAVIGVVVLNYKNYEDTLSCVKSLLNDSYSNTEIVIVDNGSENESVKIFNSQFCNQKNVSVIALDNNMGYAKGNNRGISFLRNKGIENIFIANSDLVFPDSPVLEHMAKCIEDRDAVIVPTIKNPNGSYDQRVIYKKHLLILRMAKELLKSIGKHLIGKISQANTYYDIDNVFEDCYVVSGSGFMLTRHFFEVYRGLFSDTFLYGEECGTILLVHKAKLNSKVVITDPIIHKGGASTPDNIKKMTYQRRKINLDSDIKLLKLLFMNSKECHKKY